MCCIRAWHNRYRYSKLINIASGELVSANILSIEKWEKGKPGEIKGTIENS